MPPVQQTPIQPLPVFATKSMPQKVALTLLWANAVAVILAVLYLIPKAGLVLFGTLFALADAAGAPNSTGFGFLDIVRDFATFLWMQDAPLLEVVGILIVSLAATYLLYRNRLFIPASIVAIVLLVAAIPFANAALYFSSSGASLPLGVSGVDTLTYKTLSTDPQVQGRYSIDKNHVYCSQVLPDADPATFSVIPGQGRTTKFADYAKDANHVWFSCKQIPNADPATFTMVGTDGQADDAWADAFAKDSRAVYFQGEVIAGADPSSYVVLTDDYSKDKNHVWGGAYIISDADSATFQTLMKYSQCHLNDNPNCPPDAKDAKHTYLHGQEIGQAK